MSTLGQSLSAVIPVCLGGCDQFVSRGKTYKLAMRKEINLPSIQFEQTDEHFGTHPSSPIPLLLRAMVLRAPT